MMRVGWLVDDPGYTGGAEFTMAEYRAAAPDHLFFVECPPGDVTPGLDLYVVGNCMLYKSDDKPDGKIVRIIHDIRGPGPIDSEHRIFYSPLQREIVGLHGELCPAPLDRELFKPNGSVRSGAVHVGTFGNQGKGQHELERWAREHGPLAVYGHGPFLPEGPGIDYRGPVDPAYIPGILQRAEWFVSLPTVVEGYGRNVAEAWACDCRLIVNQNVGCVWWLKHDPDAIDNARERFWDLCLNA